MYAINGIPLDNPSKAWKLRAPTEPLSKLVRRVEALRVQGRHGVIPIPSTFDPVSLVFVVETPRAALEQLYALFAAPSIALSMVGLPGRVADAVLLSADPEGFGPADAVVDATFIVRISRVFWRDAVVATSPAFPLDAGSVTVAALNTGGGLSAPVQDALVRVRGQAGGLRVADAQGSWFEYPPTIPGGSYLRFESESGRAFLTATDTWTGGTDVSGAVDFGGPLGRFELTPAFTDPAVRAAQLTVTTTTRANAQVEVRGRAAYLVT